MLDLVTIGVGVIILGVFIVLLGALKDSGGSKGVKGGGVVMIGPIPIVFGSDMRWATVAIALAIVLTVLGLLLYWR